MRKLLKARRWAIIGVIGFIFQTVIVYSYNNEKVHPYVLTSRARELLIKEDPDKYKEVGKNFNNTPADITKPPTGKDVLQGTKGTIDADVGFLGSQAITGYHFYNPVTKKGGSGISTELFANAVTYAKQFWDTAIEEYTKKASSDDERNKNKEKAYYNLGRVLHLLQDMNSVPHVYNDAHVGEREGYESWTDSLWTARDNGNIGKPNFPTESDIFAPSQLYIKEVEPKTYDNYMHSAAYDTYRKTKIQGTLFENVEQPATGDIAAMFPTQANSQGGIS